MNTLINLLALDKLIGTHCSGTSGMRLRWLFIHYACCISLECHCQNLQLLWGCIIRKRLLIKPLEPHAFVHTDAAGLQS